MIMRPLHLVLVLLSLVSAGSAALNPITAGLQPADNKAVLVYKTTPEGNL
jgi:hypothetical protein